MKSTEIFLVLDIVEIAELVASLYLCYRVIRDMEEDIEYSVTRIFLSPKSVNGMKIMMLLLVLYAIFNVVIAIFLSGDLFYVMIRSNIIMLFGGLLYYFWQISRVTRKKSAS